MHLKVLTYDRIVLEAEVKFVTLPGVDGEITAMDGHDRLIKILRKGNMHFIRSQEQEEPEREYYEIDGGIAEITHTSVILFVQDAVKVLEN
ncbi:MAG: hypothetical protein ABH871_05125 [Pseudomonadota bacterium]